MDAAQLIALMHAARERKVALFDGHDVTLRRPTDLELLEYTRGGGMPREQVFRQVTAWKGFTEADLIPSGGSDAVPFDNGVWAAWIADHPEHWDKVAGALLEMIETRNTAREGGEKNSPASSRPQPAS